MSQERDLNTQAKINIIKHLVPIDQRRPAPDPKQDLPFGKIHTNHMLVCDYLHNHSGWQDPQITAFNNFSLAPDSIVFHYGQQIFEGLKAYKLVNSNNIALFRPELNAHRFYHSAERLGMQPVPIELFLECIKALISVDQEFVLPQPASLYVRPCLIPLDRGVSYRAGLDYRFFVILSSVKQYFGAHSATTVYIEQEMVRSVRGGVGDTKAGANYACSVLALQKAKTLGADSVLWLDAIERKFIEEIGAMNIMLVYRDRIVTPPLNGSILPGVTRDSLIILAKYLGYNISHERTDINKLIKQAKSGELLEAFGCGTAAVVSPIGSLILGEERINIGDKQPGPVALKLKQALLDIQMGAAPDVFSWLMPLAI